MKRFVALLLCVFFSSGIYCAAAENTADVYGSMKWLVNAKTVIENTYFCNIGTSDFSLTTEIMFNDLKTDADASYPFLFFRCTDSDNGYALRINSLRSALSIYKVVDGNYTWLLNIPKLLAENQPLKLKINAYEDKIQIFVATLSYGYFQKPSASFTDDSFRGDKICLLYTSDAADD